MPGEVSDEYNTHHQPHFGATRTEDKLALCTICLTGIIILQRIYLPQNKLVYGMITASKFFFRVFFAQGGQEIARGDK